jgi:hypothetical protein
MSSSLTAPLSTAAPTVSELTDVAALEALVPAWGRLLETSASNEPMLSPVWLLTWWRVYGEGSGRRLRAVAFRDGDRLVGLAPLLWRRYWYRPGIPFRRLEPLGADVDEGDGVCSDYLNVLAERGAEDAVARSLAGALAGGALGGWDEFVLPVMDGEGPMPRLLTAALAEAGLDARCEQTDVAPYAPLPASWDAYLQALPKKKRYGIVRAVRDFETWADGTAELRRASTRPELEEGKRVLAALHNERWDAAGQVGAFRSPRFAAFHDAVLPQLLDAGALELLWLTVRGEPVAAIYNLVWNNKVYFYQCGRKPDAPHGQRLGVVMVAYALRAAVEAGRREFDALAGASLYKSQLLPAARPLVQVRAARRSLREWLRRAAERGIAGARGLRNALRAARGRGSAPAVEAAE